jgi:hypothetical protein
MIEIKMGAFPGNDVANKVDLHLNREPMPVIPPVLPSGAVVRYERRRMFPVSWGQRRATSDGAKGASGEGRVRGGSRV